MGWVNNSLNFFSSVPSCYQNKQEPCLFHHILWAVIPGVILKDNLESRVFSFNSHCLHWTPEKPLICNTGKWELEYLGLLPSHASLFCPSGHPFIWLCYSIFSSLPSPYKIFIQKYLIPLKKFFPLDIMVGVRIPPVVKIEPVPTSKACVY